MLKLNINKEIELTFEIQSSGLNSDKISSYLRIIIDNIEYGFPAKVGNESITVNIPSLKSITSKKLKEGEEIEAKLEIITDGNYLTPWKDTFKLLDSLKINAKIVDDKILSAEANLVNINYEDKKQEKGKVIKEEVNKRTSKKISVKDLLNMTEEDVYSYMKRAGTKKPHIQKLIYEQAESAAGSSRPIDVLKQVIKILSFKKTIGD